MPMLDLILCVLLLLVVPADALTRSRCESEPGQSRTARYARSAVMIAALLLLLAADWWWTGRSAESLGLGAPTGWAALGGLVAAAALLLGVALASRRLSPDRPRPDQLPVTPAERRGFAAFAIAAGFGWETLYRGFLLTVLAPVIGTAGAIAASAAAYGAAHGLKSAQQATASLTSALAFTIGYAATGNLWWLILLHTGLPLTALVAARPA